LLKQLRTLDEEILDWKDKLATKEVEISEMEVKKQKMKDDSEELNALKLIEVQLREKIDQDTIMIDGLKDKLRMHNDLRREDQHRISKLVELKETAEAEMRSLRSANVERVKDIELLKGSVSDQTQTVTSLKSELLQKTGDVQRLQIQLEGI